MIVVSHQRESCKECDWNDRRDVSKDADCCRKNLKEEMYLVYTDVGKDTDRCRQNLKQETLLLYKGNILQGNS